jgi:hypothetical protein
MVGKRGRKMRRGGRGRRLLQRGDSELQVKRDGGGGGRSRGMRRWQKDTPKRSFRATRSKEMEGGWGRDFGQAEIFPIADLQR